MNVYLPAARAFTVEARIDGRLTDATLVGWHLHDSTIPEALFPVIAPMDHPVAVCVACAVIDEWSFV
jgi:hypothetical protein